MDRLRHAEGENRVLKNKVRETEHRIAELTDAFNNSQRANHGLKDQAVENDSVM